MTIRAQHTRILQLSDHLHVMGETLKDAKARGMSGAGLAAYVMAETSKHKHDNEEGGGGGGGGTGTHHNAYSRRMADMTGDMTIPASVVDFLEQEVGQLREEIKIK